MSRLNIILLVARNSDYTSHFHRKYAPLCAYASIVCYTDVTLFFWANELVSSATSTSLSKSINARHSHYDRLLAASVQLGMQIQPTFSVLWDPLTIISVMTTFYARIIVIDSWSCLNNRKANNSVSTGFNVKCRCTNQSHIYI